LTWSTYSETDAKGFFLQRSDNGRDFADVAFIPAAGHSTTKHAYAYVDKATGHRVYYKLRFQGTKESDVAFSNTVTIAPASLAALRIFPNPTQDVLYVEGGEDGATEVNETSFRLTDVSGKQYLLQPAAFGAQGYKVNLNLLNAGVYTLEKITGGSVVAKSRVIKQ
jgi:hypothetical protein